jgi:hypothetical protein
MLGDSVYRFKGSGARSAGAPALYLIFNRERSYATMTTKSDKPDTQSVPAGAVDAGRYSEIHKMPSGVFDGDVTILEMTTKEESIMSKRKKLRDGSAILSVLQSCTRPDIPLDDLLLPDRYFLMVQIRRITYGDQYNFKARCPSCGETFEASVDLSKLPCKKLEKEPGHIYELKLPRSGHVLRWKHLRGSDEKILLMARKSPDDDALVPISLKLHCVSVDGVEAYDPRFFESLGGMDSSAFRAHILENGCGLDTVLELECAKCEYEFDLDMPIDVDFFWPSAARRLGKHI